MENPIKNRHQTFLAIVQFTVIAAITSLILGLMTRCQDEFKVPANPPSSVVQFATNSENLIEGQSATLVIAFTKPAVMDVSIRLSVSGDVTYGQDYSSAPELKDGFLTLDITKGQMMAYVKVSRDDNSLVEGEKHLAFTIERMDYYESKGIKLGTKRTLNVIVDDDDSPPVVNFEKSSGYISEDDVNGFVVEISQSHKAPGPGTLTIGVYDGNEPAKAIEYGVNFTTLPAATSNQIKLDLQQTETKVSFKIFPVDNSLFEDNKVFRFVLSTDAAAKPGFKPSFYLTIANDDIANASFAERSGMLGENNSEGIRVRINLTSPIPKDVKLNVLVGEPAWKESPHFSTIPEYAWTEFNDIYGYGFYEQLAMTITVPANATSAEFTVKPINDNIKGNQICNFYLTSPYSFVTANSVYKLVVLDDD